MKETVSFVRDKNRSVSDKDVSYIEKLLKMLYLFYSQRSISKKKIITELGISERTYYRYIKKLEKAGVPIFQTSDNHMTINDGRTSLLLDRIIFTEKETASLIIAGKLVDNLSDYSVMDCYKSVLYKIKTALNFAEKKDIVELISQSTSSTKIEPFKKKRFPHNSILDTQNAIIHQQIVFVKYYVFHKDEHTEREIIPIEINFRRSKWHIRAFCLLRNAYRDFRLDRIEELHLTEKKFEKNIFTIDKYLASKIISTKEKRITISFDSKIERLVYLSKSAYNIIKETELNGRIEIVFGINKFNKYEFLRWLLMWGKDCEIIKPNYIKQEIKTIVAGLHQHYNG